MKLYLVTFSYDYEGGEVIGAYSTEEKAKKALEQFVPFNADSKDIIEIEVDEYLGIVI